MGNTNASISYVARAVFTMTCVLVACIYAAPTCVPPVLKTNQVGLCSPNGSVVIWDCPTCPPGAGLSVECGREYKLGTKIDCVPCKRGFEYSSTHDIGQCKRCTECHENEEETRSCEVDRDRRCKCKAKHYRDNILNDCKPCSWCCGDDSDEHIPECKAMPQRKQCAFKVNGKPCAPMTPISTTTVTTTATPVETTTSQGPLDTKMKSQPVLIVMTSYDIGNTTGASDTGLDEKPGDLPLHVYLIIGIIVLLIFILLVLVVHIYRNSTRTTRNRASSTSSTSSTMNYSRASTSGDLQSSALLLAQEEPKKPNKDVSPNEIQISTNGVTARYIKETGAVRSSENTQPTANEKKLLICQKFGPKIEDFMCHDAKHEVCLMLNPKRPQTNDDYERVAYKAGMKFHQVKNLSHVNPMEDVFTAMIGEARTVEYFVDILNEIGRADVVNKMYDMAVSQGYNTKCLGQK